MNDSKSSRKQRVWMFDDRGKDGKFCKQSKNKLVVPQNSDTIQYLIYAYGVSYPTFKRWQSDGFMDAYREVCFQ
jgi:hypothetical protein